MRFSNETEEMKEERKLNKSYQDKLKDILHYKPYHGFYDLRDYDLPKSEFKILWDTQKILYHYKDKKEYLKKNDPILWEQLKALSADYQRTLLSYPLKNKEQDLFKEVSEEEIEK